jgi:hypothetical protein
MTADCDIHLNARRSQHGQDPREECVDGGFPPRSLAVVML